jgi:hypothetical protein
MKGEFLLYKSGLPPALLKANNLERESTTIKSNDEYENNENKKA